MQMSSGVERAVALPTWGRRRAKTGPPRRRTPLQPRDLNVGEDSLVAVELEAVTTAPALPRSRKRTALSELGNPRAPNHTSTSARDEQVPAILAPAWPVSAGTRIAGVQRCRSWLPRC